MSRALKKELLPTLSPRLIYQHLDRYVVGQERAKRLVSIAAYNHIKRVNQPVIDGKKLLKKTNILLIGPTGCGKTHIARTLADILKVPFIIADATEYTEAGYYGKDVEMMISELLFQAKHSIEEAQRGIIFIDEVDKVARRSHWAVTGAGNRDIGGEGVQQALLKLLEGRLIHVPLNLTQHWSKQEFVQIDTSDVLFICAGTFSDIHLYSAKQSLGFSRPASFPQEVKRITHKDLLNYGMLAEFLGRLPIHAQLHELSEDDLYRVLTVPPDSVLTEYKELMAIDKMELEWTEEAIREVVKAAISRRLGARGLRTIVEEVMHDIMFDAPEMTQEKVLVDREYVLQSLARPDKAR